MFSSASNYQGCDEHGGNTLYASLLSATTNSSRKNWHRILRIISVQIRILNSLRKTHQVLPSSLPSSTYTAIAIFHSEIEEFPEDGTESRLPSSTSNSVLADSIQHIGIDISNPGKEDDPEGCTLKEAARIVKEGDLNSLQKFGGGEKLVSSLSYLREEIKLGFEEQRAASLITNTEHTVNAKDCLFFFLKACKSYTHCLLLVSAALSLATEMMEQEAKYGWHDGVAILVAVFMLVTLRLVANYRQARKLQKRNKFEVRVVRGGKPQTITISSLVVGDILCLKKGDFVPADGLFVHGEGLKLDNKLHPTIDKDQHPFLYSGSEIIDGEGDMLVTSVGDDTVLSRLQSSFKIDLNKKKLTEAQIDKSYAYMEYVALSISVLISVLVLINLVLRKQDQKSNNMPDIKGDVSTHQLIKIFEGIFLKPRGKVQILTGALASMVISLQHGMPVVIVASLSHWKKKMTSEDTNVQNLSSCGTIGTVSVVCFDLTTEPTDESTETERLGCPEEIKLAVEALKNEGVGCVLMLKDDVEAVKLMACELGISNRALNCASIEVKDAELIITARMNEIVAVGSCKFEDKIHILQCLKGGGHVVAFIGGMTMNDMLALKEADVGITVSSCSVKMAEANSDIVISSMRSLSPILKSGKCAYRNIQTFTQIQLTANFSGLLVNLVTTIVLDDSPITGIHLIWVNCSICILGGLMMMMELRGHELMNEPLARTKSLLTKTMWRNVVVRAVSGAFYLLLLQFIGQAMIHMNKDVVKTMVFNSFMLCQFFDLFIAMIILARKEALLIIYSSHWFLMAAGAVMAMQVLLVEFLESLAGYERLNAMQWGFCFVYAGCLCGIGLAVKFIADSASEVSSSQRSSGSSQSGFLRLGTSPGFPLLGILFSVFLVASYSCYVNPDIGIDWTLR